MPFTPKKPVASLLFNILITRYLTPETQFDILMRTGHYAEPEPAYNLVGDWSVTVMPVPEHFDLDNFTAFYRPNSPSVCTYVRLGGNVR